MKSDNIACQRNLDLKSKANRAAMHPCYESSLEKGNQTRLPTLLYELHTFSDTALEEEEEEGGGWQHLN